MPINIQARTAHAKVVILGWGRPAIRRMYAARAMLEPILIQGIQPGGQMTITTNVENYPASPMSSRGPG